MRISGELFKLHAGVNLVHVPYRAGGEALTAVLSGEAPVYFAPVAPALPHVRQGRLRALAVTSATRMPVLPEYPTVAESGYPDYSTGNWYGLAVPAKTPADIVAALNKAAVSVVRQPAVAKRLADLGYVIVGDAPDAFAARLRSEIANLAKVLKDVRVE